MGLVNRVKNEKISKSAQKPRFFEIFQGVGGGVTPSFWDEGEEGGGVPPPLRKRKWVCRSLVRNRLCLSVLLKLWIKNCIIYFTFYCILFHNLFGIRQNNFSLPSRSNILHFMQFRYNFRPYISIYERPYETFNIRRNILVNNFSSFEFPNRDNFSPSQYITECVVALGDSYLRLVNVRGENPL